MCLFSTRSTYTTIKCTDRSLAYIKGSLKSSFKYREAWFSFQDNITISSKKQGSLTCSIDCGLSESPVLLKVACHMLLRPLFCQRVLRIPLLCVTKVRKCHRMRRRRCSYRYQEPYERQKRETSKIIDMGSRVTPCHRMRKGCPREDLHFTGKGKC